MEVAVLVPKEYDMEATVTVGAGGGGGEVVTETV